MGNLRLQRTDGAAAVELAFLLPLLVLLAFGTIQFGIAYNRSQGMNAAVREGARLAAAGTGTFADVEDRVEQTLQNNDAGAGFPAPGGPNPDTPAGRLQQLKDDVVVTAEYFDAASVSLGSALTYAPLLNICDPLLPDEVHSVKITARIEPASRQTAYGVTIPLMPFDGGTFEMPFERFAVFPCLA